MDSGAEEDDRLIVSEFDQFLATQIEILVGFYVLVALLPFVRGNYYQI